MAMLSALPKSAAVVAIRFDASGDLQMLPQFSAKSALGNRVYRATASGVMLAAMVGIGCSSLGAGVEIAYLR